MTTNSPDEPTSTPTDSGVSAGSAALGITESFANQIGSENFSFSASVGGVFGIIAVILPSLVFMIAFELWELKVALAASVAVVVFSLINALVLRKPLSGIVGAVIGVAISVAWTLWSGSGSNFYAPGLVLNLVYGVILAGSVLFKHDVAGEALRMLFSEDMNRASRTQVRDFRRATTRVTLIWASLFGLRLLIQAPLYFADAVTALGIARLTMGVPLTAFAAWLSWMLLRPWYLALCREN